MSNATTTETTETATTTEKKEKALAPEYQVDREARPEFDHTKPKDKIEPGQSYVIGCENLIPHESNARMELSVDDMVHKIVQSKGIETNLLVMLRGDGNFTIKDVLEGNVKATVLKGHRRLAGINWLRDHDQAFYDEYLKNRIPVQFVINPTEDEEMILLHDHSGVKGLTPPEVAMQVRAFIKKGKTLTEIIDLMLPIFCDQCTAQAKINEIRAKAKAGEITRSEERARLHKTLRGMAQGYEALAYCPEEVFEWFAMSEIPSLAVKKGVKVKKFPRNHYKDISKIMRDINLYKDADARKKAALNKFEAFKAEALGTPAEVDDGPAVRSMSKAELEKLVPSLNSTTFQNILLGVAGEATHRDQFDLIDAKLNLYDAAFKVKGAELITILENIVKGE